MAHSLCLGEKEDDDESLGTVFVCNVGLALNVCSPCFRFAQVLGQCLFIVPSDGEPFGPRLGLRLCAAYFFM